MRCVIKEIWYKNNLTYTLKITALVNYMYLTECAVRRLARGQNYGTNKISQQDQDQFNWFNI